MEVGANNRNRGDSNYMYGAGNGGAGGELEGIDGQSVNNATLNSVPAFLYHGIGTGGKQVTGGRGLEIDSSNNITLDTLTGTFGDANPVNMEQLYRPQSGGGSGYYGGGMSAHGGAGGGSSFISGHSGCDGINSLGIHTGQAAHYSGEVFKNTKMIAGNKTMPSTENGTTIGRSGNGYVKITYINLEYKETFAKYAVAPNYGETTQTLYSALYTSNDSKNAVTQNDRYDNYYIGNYAYSQSLFSITDNYREIINPQRGTGVYSFFTTVVSGSNSINLVRNSNLNRWISIYIQAGYLTTGVNVSNFSISFVNGTKCTLQQAVNNGYIEPLVIVSALSTAGSSNYLWGNFYNMYTGGTTDTANYPIGYIMFKVKNKSPLSGVSITSNKNFNTNGDGIAVFEKEEGFEVSITPFY